MPRFRQTAEIIKLMSRKERVRNVGVVAHIDHGKTTMTDSLLVEAGLLPLQVAGSARALDYLEEEQRRGITIKTANISFLHEMGGEKYLINLVDTPGHVDFTGKVARALRAIDGVVVVVDAVEEIMAQTETVVRQALAERVKPVLFINKVDRLVKELRLSPAEIQEKFVRTINDFNNLIELYTESEFREAWKVDSEKGSIVLGSALDKWGFTLKIAETKRTSFIDREILDAYRNGDPTRLSRIIPLHTAILDMVVKNTPSPIESQKYRVRRIWRGKIDSEIGQAMTNCDENGPTVMCITAVQVIPNEGLVATGRIFSGSVKNGDQVYLVNAGEDRRIEKVSVYMSAFRETVNKVSSGNIAAIAGLETARPGETVVESRCRGLVTPFERIQYFSEPVVTIAIEPRKPNDLPRVLEALKELVIEDPDLKVNVDKETGQYLLGGMGELHLEVAVNFLKKRIGDVELSVSTPTASYRETVFAKGALVVAKSPNKLNRFSVQVEPLDSKTMAIVEQNFSDNQQELNKRINGLVGQDVWAVDEHANVLVGLIKKESVPEDARINVSQSFHWACKTGPLCEQPLRGIQVKFVDAQFDENSDNRDSSQVIRAFSRAILGSFLTAQPLLMEAVYKIEVSVPLQWFGACSNMIARRHGKIEATEQKGGLAIIRGSIPVAKTFGLSSEMRSATSGRAFWQLVFDRWERMPEKLASETIKRLREKKGLPPDVPKPEVFVDEIHN